MIKRNIFFIIFLTLFNFSVSAQEAYNQHDKNGERHGKWRKTFDDTKQVRYEGQFAHGKEVGLFKFYKLVGKKSVLTATKQFNPDNDNAQVTFIASDGKIISKGNMNGKRRVGEWLYYHNNSDKVMTKEFYNENGLLHGEKLIYFKNGQVTETLRYTNGKKDGTAKNYIESGVLIKAYTYKDDQLHGSYKDYASDGSLMVEGQFKEGKKHGRWYFYKHGEVVKEKDFSDPKTFHKN